MSDSPDNSAQLKCLRQHIVDFLDYQLENDLITEKRAGQLARATLDHLSDTLNRPEIYTVIEKLKTDFPEELPDLDAAFLECESKIARADIDKQILAQVASGDIDSALAKLGEYKLK